MKTTLPVLLLLFVTTAQAADDQIGVPGGAFMMGCSVGDSSCDKDEGPEGGVSVTVGEFLIDKNEVTVERYRKCVSAKKCREPAPAWCNYNTAGNDKHPMNCVSWDDASTLCAFEGKRLPLEAEWEKAARAGSVMRYPWGGYATCKEAILNDLKTKGSGGEEDGCGTDNTFPVGSRKPNALGIYDMNGNILEWTANWYDPNAFTKVYAKGDLRGPATGEKHVARGGAWDDRPIALRSSNRDPRVPTQIGGSLGFRCAQDIIK